MKTPTISIIIPVSNRSNLIRETLDSIISQSYKNWECIVVDDRSTDNSFEVVEGYCLSDSRINVFKRPKKMLKGANSCRNYGFSKSSGDFIIWFDSDDLMTPDHIESKLKEIQKKKLDFLVARTQNFKDGKFLEPYRYDKKKYGIKASDFILLKIHWYTYDVMLTREVAKRISWNEKMRSWQDYNYFCKMLLITEKGGYLDKVLTHRRLHSNSIQKSLNQTPDIFNKELLENRLLTFNDISGEIDAFVRKELVFGMMNLCFEITKVGNRSSHINAVLRIVLNELGLESKVYFHLALFTSHVFGKGYYFLHKAKHGHFKKVISYQ